VLRSGARVPEEKAIATECGDIDIREPEDESWPVVALVPGQIAL